MAKRIVRSKETKSKVGTVTPKPRSPQTKTTSTAKKTVTKTAVKAPAKTAGNVDIRAVREWAIGKGHDVGTRGRLSVELIAAYKADQRVTRKAQKEVAAGTATKTATKTRATTKARAKSK